MLLTFDSLTHGLRYDDDDDDAWISASPSPLNFIHAYILLRQQGHDNTAAGFMGSCK